MAGGQGGTDNQGTIQGGRPGGTGGTGYTGNPGNPGSPATAGNFGGTGGGGGGAGGGVGGAGGAYFNNSNQIGTGGAGGVAGVNNGAGGNAPPAPSNGVASGAGGGGGGGGANGFNTAGALANAVNLRGGVGGVGGPQYNASGGGGGGGAGGYGVVVRGAGNSTNAGNVYGGNGGAGGISAQGAGGMGGGGGAGGLFTANGAALANTGTFTGGLGGAGGGNSGNAAVQQAVGGAGGAGGAGLAFGSNFTLTSNTNAVTGGAGGAGGAGANANQLGFRPNGNGGVGGAGLSGAAGGTVNNGAAITGGNGGAAGNSGAAYAGVAGNGGAGISGAGLTINNLGAGATVIGGNGAARGAGRVNNNYNPGANAPGIGGAGVTGSNLTITNTGTISGGLGNAGAAGAARADAIDTTGGTNSLTLGNAATQGTLTGGIGVGGSLSVDTGTAAGVSRTLANQIHNYSGTATGSLQKAGAGTLVLSGANTYSGGTTINAGVLELAQGATYNTSNILQSAAAGTGAITFATLSGTATARLTLGAAAQPGNNGTFSNTLTNFGTGSQLDLAGLANGQVSYNSANSSITVTGTRGGASVTQNFALATPQSTNFMAQSDGAGGTLITVCYCTGTRILTDRGEVAVEALRKGDVAVTASGTHKPIAWIGSRVVNCARLVDPDRVWPVRVRAGAFGAGSPARDLLVSPDHAVAVGPGYGLVEEAPVLVPAFALVNGATVVREPVEAVTYWHVELEGGHDLLLAEGLAAESYLDCGNRGFFACEDAAMDPGPDAPASCLERTDDGARLAPVRAWMRERALALGWVLDAGDPLAGLRLVVDGATVLPEADGLRARFLVPAGAADVRLISGAAVPWEVSGAGDARSLGLCIARLTASDGWGETRSIPLDDPRLGEGWHGVEVHGDGLLRWTDGRARLAVELWAGCAGAFFLRLDLGCACLPAWRAPAGLLAAGAAAGGHLRGLAARG